MIEVAFLLISGQKHSQIYKLFFGVASFMKSRDLKKFFYSSDFMYFLLEEGKLTNNRSHPKINDAPPNGVIMATILLLGNPRCDNKILKYIEPEKRIIPVKKRYPA